MFMSTICWTVRGCYAECGMSLISSVMHIYIHTFTVYIYIYIDIPQEDRCVDGCIHTSSHIYSIVYIKKEQTTNHDRSPHFHHVVKPSFNSDRYIHCPLPSTVTFGIGDLPQRWMKNVARLRNEKQTSDLPGE